MSNVSNAKTAGRQAGFAYLAEIIFALAGYAPLAWFLAGAPRLVLARLAATHTLFVLTLAAAVIGFLVWVIQGCLLYRLVDFAGRRAALFMIITIVAGAAANWLSLFQLLPLAGPGGSSLEPAAAWASVQSYKHILLLAQVFSGLWMLAFGWLVLRSRIAPSFLGFCFIAGGCSYLMAFATAFAPIFNNLQAFQITSYVLIAAAMIAEFGMCLWLLIKGVSDKYLGQTA